MTSAHQRVEQEGVRLFFSPEIPDDQRMTAPPYSDLCPGCNAVVCAPLSVDPEPDRRGVVAFYRHRACGFQWSCGWGLWS